MSRLRSVFTIFADVPSRYLCEIRGTYKADDMMTVLASYTIDTKKDKLHGYKVVEFIM